MDNTNSLREYENNVKIFVVEYNDDGHNGFHEVFNTLKEANEFAKNEYLENQKKYDNIETAYVNVFSMDEGVYNAYFTTGELDGNFDDFAHFTDDMFNSKYPSEIEHSKVVSKENYEAIQEAIETLKGLDTLTAKDVFENMDRIFNDAGKPNVTEVISKALDGVDFLIDVSHPEWYKEAREEATNQGIDINDVLDEFYPDEMDYTDDEEYMLPIIEDALKYEEYSISYPKKDSSDWIDAEDINREIIDELSDMGVEMTDDEFNAEYDRASLINFLSEFKVEISKEISLEASDLIEEKLELLDAIKEINADDVLRGISIHEHGKASNSIYLRSEVPFLLDNDEAPTDRRIQITDIVIPRDYTLEDIKEKPQILKQTIENRLNNGDFTIAYPDFEDDYEHFQDISSEILTSLSNMGVEIDNSEIDKDFSRESLIDYLNEFNQEEVKMEVSKIMNYQDVKNNLMDLQGIDINEFEELIVAGFEDFEARENGYNTVIIDRVDEDEYIAHTDHESAMKFEIKFVEDKENETISVESVDVISDIAREWKIDDLSIVEKGDGLEVFQNINDHYKYLGSIYPEYDMEDCISALFRDENPIEAGWEDGNGNSLSYEGWGDGLTSYYFDEIASNSEMTIFEIVENIRDVVNPPISVNCELEKKEGNLATLSVESEAVDLNGEPKFKASFELEERNDTYKITSWNVENESMKNLYISEVNNYEHIKDIEDIDLFIDKESIGIDESGITYIKDEKEFSKIEELASILKDVDETFEKYPTNEKIQALREDKDKAIKKGSLDDVKKVKEKIDVELNPEKETKKKVHER